MPRILKLRETLPELKSSLGVRMNISPLLPFLCVSFFFAREISYSWSNVHTCLASSLHCFEVGTRSETSPCDSESESRTCSQRDSKTVLKIINCMHLFVLFISICNTKKIAKNYKKSVIMNFHSCPSTCCLSFYF